MRERLARWIAAWTGVLVVMLSGAFAVVQNPSAQEARVVDAGQVRVAQADKGLVLPPPPVPPAAEPAQVDPPAPPVASTEVVEAGRRLFAEQTCGRCHSVAGKGNPRNPLDGITEGRSDEDIRHWIVGDEAVREEMSPRAFAGKQRYASLSADQVAALVAYLRTLALQ